MEEVESPKSKQNKSLEFVKFGLVLAKSLESSYVREFIKNEALRQFDGDFDVLIQLAGEKKVQGSKSFNDVLRENSDSGIDIDRTLFESPLLNVYVPNLKTFNAKTWNTENDIPWVALSVGNESDEKIQIVNGAGDIREISLLQEPDFPVVVLKLNEIARVANEREPNLEGNKIVAGIDYSFEIPNDLATENSHGARRKVGRLSDFDQNWVDAYNKGQGCNDCYHRDFIYYGISPTDQIFEGPFNTRYSEAITAIEFENEAALQVVTSDWTEGALELHINIFFIGGNSALDKIEKVIFVFPEYLHDGYFQPVQYTLPNPIYIAPWKMNLYGDRWKVSVIEFDPASTMIREFSHSTTKATNFKADVNGEVDKVKIGVGFGSSSQTVYSGSISIQTTIESNVLGDAILNWFDPVIIGIAPWFPLSRRIVFTNELTTGSIRLTFEPTRVY